MKSKRSSPSYMSRLLASAVLIVAAAVTARGAQATNELADGENIVITSTNGAVFEGNQVIWRGDVRVSDREMDLMCELLTINFHTNSGSRQIESIVAETNVVVAQKDSWAFGDRAVYTVTNDLVVLSAETGEVLLDNPDFYLMAPFVIFDRQSGKFHAPGNVVMGGRGDFGTNSLGIGLPGTSPKPPRAPRSDRNAPSP